MAEFAAALPLLLADAGLWVGLLITLAIFSLLFGDNLLARVAQHLLVGAGMGYAVLLAVQYVLAPRLLAPMARGEWLSHLLLLLLALLLLVAGLERIFAQGGELGGRSVQTGRGRKLLHGLGAIPLAIVLGVGMGAAVVGIVQGTLYVQVWQVLVGTWDDAPAGAGVWMGALTLLLTTATLLHLSLNRREQIDPLPRPLRDLLALWMWVGERALWIATGILLARLFASRLTLLVDRMGWLANSLQATGLWQWMQTIWTNLVS